MLRCPVSNLNHKPLKLQKKNLKQTYLLEGKVPWNKLSSCKFKVSPSSKVDCSSVFTALRPTIIKITTVIMFFWSDLKTWEEWPIRFTSSMQMPNEKTTEESTVQRWNELERNEDCDYKCVSSYPFLLLDFSPKADVNVLWNSN